MAPATRRAIVVVTNDLVTDNRVARTCSVLQDLGFEVELVGRTLPDSPAIQRGYTTTRFRLPFKTGALFYAVFNLRVFFHLLFSKANVMVANDLDTLLACFVAARMKGSTLVYDTHEYFTEVPELMRRSGVRTVWLSIERWIFPRLRMVITVNDSIASAYDQRYPERAARWGGVEVVRNIPMPRPVGPLPPRAELGLPQDAFILILQGSGINVDRGAEEVVLAMRELPGCLLLLVGGGDAWPALHDMVRDHGLEDRVRFIDRLPYEGMMHYTRNADLGISLDKNTNLNYRFSLPNKVFDYFNAGIPVLVTDLPEVAALVKRYDTGVVIPDPAPEHIVQAVSAMRMDPSRLAAMRTNATFAARELDGGKEKEKLATLLRTIAG